MTLDFTKFAAEGEAFKNELAEALNYPVDKNRAARVLKSVLHALRDQLTPEESVQMIAQFPMFLKAVYVLDWNLKKKKRIKHYDAFVEEIISIHGEISDIDFPTNEDVEEAIDVIFKLLRKYISLGEMEDIKAVLPKELKPMLNWALMV